MLTRLGFRAITALTGILPRRVQYSISRPAADLYFLCGRQSREAVRANLSIALGPDTSEKLLRRETREVFRAFGQYLCEFFGAAHWNNQFIDEHVVVQGREHLDAALARGHGVVFCSGHYSNWELGAMVVARLGYPISGVFQTHANARDNELFIKQRAHWGIGVIPSEHGAKGALRALRNNETVALMGDRTTGGSEITVQFFGQPVQLPLGPFRIALTSGAALLPTFVHRRANGQFTLEIGAPLNAGTDGSIHERAARLGQAWAHVLESLIRTDPSQWTVFYDFFKSKAKIEPLPSKVSVAASAVHENREQPQ